MPMRDGIGGGGGAYSREQQIYIAGTFRGFSMWLKVLGLIEYGGRGAATLTLHMHRDVPIGCTMLPNHAPV